MLSCRQRRARIDQRRTGLALLTGAAAGTLGGLFGIGGGIIMVPLMAAYLGLTQHLAHGTSLAVIIFQSLSGALAYSQQGVLNLNLALAAAVGTVPGAVLGAWAMSRVPPGPLRKVFGLFLLVVAFRLLLV